MKIDATMMLQRTSEMHCALRGNVCSVSGFGRGEAAKISVLGGSLDASRPFSISGAPTNAYKLALTVLVRFSSVLLVQSAVSAAKIAYRVVGSVAIDMVKHVARPLAINVQPRNTVRLKVHPVNADASVSERHPSWFRSCAGIVSSVRFPDENAGVLIVIKKLAHALRGYHFTSHEALLMLIGQKPGRVAIAYPVSSF